VVPQVGWNQVRQQSSNPLFRSIKDSAFFYFVHSYYCEPAETEVIAGETDYGVAYASVVARENLFGVQFHPEKSQKDGLRMLANFARG
jgi:glutamine amidotransferase